jgi:hypothetical protein
MNLSLAHRAQEVLHAVRFSIGQLGVKYQPFLEVLF